MFLYCYIKFLRRPDSKFIIRNFFGLYLRQQPFIKLFGDRSGDPGNIHFIFQDAASFVSKLAESRNEFENKRQA